MRNVLVALAIAAAVCVVAGEEAANGDAASHSPAPEAAKAAKVVTVGEFVLSYDLDGDMVDISLTYPTTGWVAVAFKPTRMMKDANIIIGYASDDGTSVVEDHFGVGMTRHKPDTEVGGGSHVEDGTCEEKDGSTTMSFSIPLDSGDERDCVLETGKQITIALAAGRRDSFSKHQTVIKTSIRL
jgi:hypothetical protein